MARENQGLQIALIIFVILTILLGVTTFFFFRQYEEFALKAKANLEDANKMKTANNNILSENNDMKKLMGFAPTDKLDTIHEEFNKDMETYAANFEESNRVYRQVLAYLFNVIEKKNVSLAAEQVKVQELKDLNERREAEKQPQIEEHEVAAKKAGDDLAGERQKFNADRANLTKEKDGLQANLQKARKEADTRVAKIQSKLEEANVRLQQLAKLNTQKSDQLESVRKQTFEVADGKIRWVNQRNGTVWVNLGRSDALGRQTSFSVYAADTQDVTRAGKKASIEVTQILGDHLAEARIIEDSISDPVMPGDVIHTPVWAPGQQERFALAGMMDLDGDGNNDQATVRNLITLNGGVIDAELSDKGKRIGKMSTETRYLVLGEAPTADASPELLDGWSKMDQEANRLGIKKIPLQDLLKRMGWKNRSQVVTFGAGSNPDDFRAKPLDGTNRASTGNVSDLFRKRSAPRSSNGSAY